MSEPNESLPPASSPPPVPKSKKGMSTGCIVALVLGVVGLGFAMLMLLALAGGWFARNTARGMQVKAQMKSLELAIKAYQTEYNRFPSPQSPPPLADNTTGYDTTSVEGRQIIETLTAADTQKNPRGIAFYEPPPFHRSGGGYTKEGGLVDLWGNKGCIIVMDYDGDHKIADPEHPGATIKASVIIYSAGPDGDFSTWKDNVKSW